jgi:TP901 family phage tail tape measure protein
MSLIVKIGADTRKFDREIGKLTKDVNTIGSKFTSAGTAMATAISAPLVGVGVLAAKTGVTFESSMSKVAATLGTTTDKIGELETLAKEMGSSTKFSASQAAEGINYMAMAGWDTNQIMKGLPAVLNLAAAGGMELGAASDIVTDAMTGLGLGADKAGWMVDLMAKTASSANTSVEQMGNAMIIVAGQANALGIGADELSLALGHMANAGIKGELAGQHLSAGIRQLVNPTKKQQEYMEKYGVALQKNEDGTVNLTDTMQNMRDSLNGLDGVTKAQVMSVLLGADAQKSWAAIVNASQEDFDKLADSIANSEGAGQKMADTMSDNLEGKLLSLQSAIEGVFIELYEHMKPALEAIVDGIMAMVQAFASLSPKTQAFIVLLAGFAIAIGPILIAIGSFIKALGFVKAALAAVKIASFGALSIWILIAVAVAALVLAIIFYWDEIVAVTKAVWDTIATYMKDLWSGISETASEVWGAIAEFFTTLWQGISDTATEVWTVIATFFTDLWEGIKTSTEETWTAITDFIIGIWESWLAFALPIYKAIWDAIVSVWEGIKTVTSTVWDFITQYLTAIWTALVYLLTPIFTKIRDFVLSVWNSIKTFSSNVWNGIKTTLTNVWNSVSSTATTVWEKIRSFFVSWLNKVRTNMTTVWNAIKAVVSNVWNSIKAIASSVWNAVQKVIMGPINRVRTMATNAFNSLRTSVSSIFNSIKSTAVSIWNSISTSVTGVVSKLTSGVSSAFEGMKSAVLGVWDGIKAGMKFVLNGIISMINKFIGGFNTPAKLLNKLPGVDAPTIPNIPMLATGGTIFGNGQAIVGEAGPELVSKSGSSVKVTPLSNQEKAAGIGGAMGGGGGTIEVPVILDSREIAKVVAPHMDSSLRARRDSKNRSRGGW